MLSKIYAQSYRENTIQNIKDFNNESFGSDKRHNLRIKTICFIHYCGYNASEIANIIKHYNPSLLNDLGRQKYTNEYYISEVLQSYNKKMNITKEETSTEKERSSFSNTSLRSKENISFKAPNVEERYALIPDEDKNKSFFKNTNIIAYGYKVDGIEKYNIYGTMYKYNPHAVPYYRSISGSDHVLFVCDLDKSNFNNSLDETRAYADELRKKMKFDIFKFSGSEGYHLIKYMPKETTIDELKDLAFTLDPFKNKLDWNMFTVYDRLIRGYNVNWKTNLMSCDVIIK